MASAGADWQTNPATQIAWGLNYIGGRYGSPSAAYSAWLSRSPHWYAGGGRVPYAGAFEDGGTFKTNGPTMFMAGDGHSPKETVTVQRGHGVSAEGGVTIQSMVIHAGSDTIAADVQREVAHGIKLAWAQLEAELAREATT